MRRKRDPESRWREKTRHEREALEEYAAFEREWAHDIILWYKVKKIEIPDDQYRAALFFINKEFLDKPGSLTLLYSVHKRCIDELPKPTRETAFDLQAYKYRLYAAALEKGGF
jgi:hypothetical protein